LVWTGSLLFWCQPRLAKLVRGPEGETALLPAGWALVGALAFQFLVAVYGGYFGAGIGVLMLTSLGLMGVGDIHQMNAIKSLLAAAINVMSIFVFVAAGQVAWGLAVPMMVGSITGGYFGAVLGRMLPKEAGRWFVIVVGLGLAAWDFLKR